ncbi:MAG: PKD domain-containing protein [Bacteroidales bacterium]|nr:PKD domain-containing protein [Bacteroidales bacterium]
MKYIQYFFSSALILIVIPCYPQQICFSGNTNQVLTKEWLREYGCITTDGSVKRRSDTMPTLGNIEVISYALSFMFPGGSKYTTCTGCCLTDDMIKDINAGSRGEKFYIEDIKGLDHATGKVIHLGSFNFRLDGQAPIADFEADRKLCMVGSPIDFKNKSKWKPDNLVWDFGDGEPAPVSYHYYKTPGTYTVSLIASNQWGVDTMIKKDFIRVIPKILNVPCANMPIVTDFDGNTYRTVQIGDQCWLAENLKSRHYADGTEITGIFEEDQDCKKCYKEWKKITKVFGLQYNWSAAMNMAKDVDSLPPNLQGVCPNGWHVPGEKDWQELMDYLGGESPINMQKLIGAGWLSTENREEYSLKTLDQYNSEFGSAYLYIEAIDKYTYNGTKATITKEYKRHVKYYKVDYWIGKFESSSNYGYTTIRCIRD